MGRFIASCNCSLFSLGVTSSLEAKREEMGYRGLLFFYSKARLNFSAIARTHVAGTETMQLTMFKSDNGRGLWVYDAVIWTYDIICRKKEGTISSQF